MKTPKTQWFVAAIAVAWQPIINSPSAMSQVGINTVTPDPSSILDMVSTNQGMLITRMTAAERDAIASPARGLMVFVTTDSAFYYNNGAPASPNWARFMAGSGSSGGWTLTGNAGTTSATNFLGTTDNVSLRFRTNNTERMYIDSANGQVGIGTTSPTEKLHVSGSIRATGSFLASEGTAGTPGYRFDTNPDNGMFQPGGQGVAFSTEANERMRITNNGNVGIGTTAPEGLLHIGAGGVAGNAGRVEIYGLDSITIGDKRTQLNVFSTAAMATDVGGLIGIGGNYTTTKITFAGIAGKKANATSGNTEGYLGLYTRENAALLTEKVRITGSGNVGIGTTTTTFRETDAGSDFNSALVIKMPTSENGRMLLLPASGSNNALYGFGIVNSNSRQIRTAVIVGISTATAGSETGQLTFETKPSTGLTVERMRIDSSGNVGIGTTGPSTSLSIAGTAYNQIELTTSGGSTKAYLGTDGAANVWLQANRRTDNGVFSDIGKTANSIALMNANGAGYIQFNTSNINNSQPGEAMRITGAGNVGIGTTGPNTKLQVTGGDMYTSSAANGLIVKSPDGLTCRRIGIDNTGALTLTPVACP